MAEGTKYFIDVTDPKNGSRTRASYDQEFGLVAVSHTKTTGKFASFAFNPLVGLPAKRAVTQFHIGEQGNEVVIPGLSAKTFNEILREGTKLAEKSPAQKPRPEIKGLDSLIRALNH